MRHGERRVSRGWGRGRFYTSTVAIAGAGSGTDSATVDTSAPHRGARRIGLLGGTFDPPHYGHLAAAVNVRHALGLDEVLMVVAGSPWQKEGTRPISAAADRLAMVEAALDGVVGVVASAIEVNRSGASYTVDTVKELLAASPGTEVYVIVGADAAALITTWERYDELVRICRLVVVDRPGPTADLPPVADWICVGVPHLDISSTDLRARFADGRPLDFLLPPATVRVARERGLYGSDARHRDTAGTPHR